MKADALIGLLAAVGGLDMLPQRRHREAGALTSWRMPGAKAKRRAKDKAARKARRINRK